MKDKKIRIIAGILFFGGIYWAILCLGILPLFISGIPHQKTLADLGLSVIVPQRLDHSGIRSMDRMVSPNGRTGMDTKEKAFLVALCSSELCIHLHLE